MGVYGGSALRAINYILTEVHKGSDDFDAVSGKVGVFVLNNKVKKTYDLATKTFEVKLEIGVTVKDYQPYDEKKLDESRFVLQGDDKKACENALREEIVAFYEEMKEKDVDVFGVEQWFYAKYGKKSDIKFGDVTFSLQVDMKPES